MSDVNSVATWSAATAQAQVKATIGLRVLKLAEQAGQQTAQLVQETVEAVIESLRASATGGQRQVDVFA